MAENEDMNRLWEEWLLSTYRVTYSAQQTKVRIIEGESQLAVITEMKSHKLHTYDVPYTHNG